MTSHNNDSTSHAESSRMGAIHEAEDSSTRLRRLRQDHTRFSPQSESSSPQQERVQLPVLPHETVHNLVADDGVSVPIIEMQLPFEVSLQQSEYQEKIPGQGTFTSDMIETTVRSYAAKKGNDAKGEEVRKKAAEKAYVTKGKEGRRNATKKGNITKGEEGRSEAARKGQDTRGEEGRREASEKAKKTLGKEGRREAAKKGYNTKKFNKEFSDMVDLSGGAGSSHGT